MGQLKIILLATAGISLGARSQTAHTGDSAAKTPSSALSTFRKELATIHKSSAPLADFGAWARQRPSSCSFKDLCGYISTNAEQAYLYRSPSGGGAANYQLFDLERSVEQCLTSDKLAKEHLSPDTFEKKIKLSVHKENQKMALRFGALKKSIQAHGEQDTYLEIQHGSMLALQQGKVTPIQFASGSPMPKDKLKAILAANLKAAEDAARRKFSAETRARYLEHAFAGYEGFYDTNSVFAEVSPVKLAEGSPNPYLKPAKFFDAKDAGGAKQLLANQADYQKNLNKAYGVFADSRQAISKILEARRTPENSAEIDKLQARMQTVQFQYFLNPGGPQGSCSLPNAFYDPNSHVIVVCPQLLELPPMALKSILAHELGHVIDPCVSSWPIHRVQVTTPKTPPRPALFSPTLPVKPNNAQYTVDVFGGSEFNHPRPGFTVKSLSRTEGTPSDRYPFASVAACLQTSRSAGARVPKLNELLAPLDAQIEDMKRTGGSGEALGRLQASRDSLATEMPKHAGCSPPLPGEPQSQIQEAFADWISSKVVAADIGKAPIAARSRMAFEAMLDLLAAKCPLPHGKAFESAQQIFEQSPSCQTKKSLMNDFFAVKAAKKREADAHPWSATRMERIYAAQPEYGAALGCPTPSPQEGLVACE